MPKKIDYVDWGFVDAKGTGLDIDFETGKIYGTPSCEAGTYNCRVNVVTNYGTAEEYITVNVKEPVPVGGDICIGLGASPKLGTSVVSFGEMLYFPLSHFGFRHATPSNEITIENVTFSNTSPNSSTAKYTSEIGSSSSVMYRGFDKTTGNIVISWQKSGTFGTNGYGVCYVRIKTNKGYLQATNSAGYDIHPNWFRLILCTKNRNLYAGKIPARGSGYDFSQATKIGELTSSNYRSNYIY